MTQDFKMRFAMDIFGLPIMLFKQIPGNNLIKERLLRSSQESRVSHALMLHGPEGNAGFPLAMAFAQYLNCTGEKVDDACGKCPSCLKANKLIHPDIHFIFPVSTTKKIKTDPVSDMFLAEWRTYIAELPYPSLSGWMNFLEIENKQGGIFKKEAEGLLRKMNLKAFESDFKVVIIWLPEKMNAPTANKLLKIIEEPPDKTVFLLVAEQTQNILPTILSRTQLIRISKFSDNEIVDGMNILYPGQDQQIKDLVALSGGSILSAIDLLNTTDQVRFNQDQFIKWMRMAFKYKIHELMSWIPGIATIGRERQKAFLGYCLHLIRENYLLNQKLESLTRMTKEEMEFSSKFNRFIHSENIESLSVIFSKAIRQIEMNANPRILFLDLSHEIFVALNTKNSA
jgi:DNA polymerase-3 subunit delta'